MKFLDSTNRREQGGVDRVMKRLMILFLLFISTCFIGKGQDSKPILNIHVAEAGTLDQISVTVPPCIDTGGSSFMCKLDVKITGELNEKDFRTLSQLLEHRWFDLDLSEVNLTEIPRKAFMIKGGTNEGSTVCDAWVQKIILPSTLIKINDLAFAKCEYLKEVDLSKCTKLNYVGYMAFGSCENLLSIDLSNCTELKILGNNAGSIGPFNECKRLKQMILPPNLEIIDSDTFRSCDLEEIEMPSSVKQIKSGAFDIYNLREIKMYSYEPPVISQNTFTSEITKNATLKVPSGQLSKYKEAEHWKEFLSIEEYNPNGGDLIHHSIQVSYNEGSVKLNDNYIENGSSVSVTDQTDIRLLIQPKTNYHLKQVIVNDRDMTGQVKDKLLTLLSVSCDQMITITFELNIYTVQVSYNNEGGTVKVNDDIVTSGLPSSVTALTNVEVAITPKTGYHIEKVLRFYTDVTNQLANNILTISSISANTELTVRFEQDALINHTVKVSYNEGGKVKINNTLVTNGAPIPFDDKADIQLSIIPDTDYHLEQVMVGSTDMTQEVRNNLLLLSAISEDKDIKVTFKKNAPTSYTFSVHYPGLGNGTIKVDGEVARNGLIKTIPANSKIEIELLPDEGYYIARAKVGTTDITNQLINNRYTISSLSSDSYISVTFEKIPTYCLNIKMEGGNSDIKIDDKLVTNSTQVTGIKESCSLYFQPSKYYNIKNVTLGETNITNQIQDGRYKIESINSDLTLKIEYIRKQYTLSVNIQGADKIQINGEDITNGSSITTNSGYNRIDISSEYYLIKQVLLDNEIIEKGPSGYIEISMDSDKKLTIIAELREKREVSLTSEEPGTLASHLSEEDMKMVTDLNISGEIDQRDFLVLNQMQSLYKLNLIVTIREYNNYPANTIPENAFHNNKTIKMIDLSNSIEAIGKQAFWGSAISHINKYDENLTKIGEEAFKDCQYLITIPSTYNVPVIEKSTFENCSSLSALPSLYNLIEVKESAFRNCKNLSVDLGSSLERIGNYAFENVKEINTLPVFQGEAKLSYIGTDACKGTQSNRFDFSNYPYLQELPNFEGSSNLNHITFPPNVKEVPANTFKGCTSLQEVYMNNKIERIAENAFCDSNGISYLYVPVNNTPEIFTNSFSEFCYINAALIVPTDYMYFYRHHAVWSKFTEIKHLGNDSHRQISATISEGGHVLSKAEEDMYPNNTFDTGSYNSISYPTSSRVEFIVEIDKGYSIESIILNGEDITNTLDNNNKFIIPNLMVDSHLEVKFKKEEDPTGTETIHINKHIYLSGSNQLVFSDFKIGTHAIVFDASGRMIKQITIRNNMERIDLPGRGIYFVRVENKSTKIIL